MSNPIDTAVIDVQKEQTEAKEEIEQKEASVVFVSAFASHSRKEIFRKFWRLYAIGLAVSLGGMYNGYCGSATGNIVANPGFIRQFGTVIQVDGTVVLDASHVSFWSGFQYVGQVVFQCLSPFVADRFGRKAAMYAVLLLMLTAIILEIVARDWKVFLIAKILAGASNGFVGTGIMTYVSEIAITQVRGSLLGAFSLFFGLGGLFNAVGLQILAETTPYKYLNGIYSQFALFGLFAIVVLAVPESPAWLCDRGRHDDAKRSLRRLVGDVAGYDIELEYAVLRQETESSQAFAESHGKNDWIALFKWINFKRCLAATLPFSYQNFVGTPLVFGQTTYFFQIAGLSNAFLGSTIISVILVVGIFVSFYTVETVSRRSSVLWGGALMSGVDFAIGGLGFASATTATGAVLITLCSIWVFIYSLSLAPIGWISIVEVSSPRLRAKTAAVATIIQSLSNILFSYTVPYMLSDQYAGWGAKIGFFFGGIAALFWIPCYVLYPETKGRSYAELDELYEQGVAPRYFAGTRTAAQDNAIPHDNTTPHDDATSPDYTSGHPHV